MTEDSFRHTLAALPTGVALIAAEVDGQDDAMLVNSLSSLSLDPPLVSVAFTQSSTTWPRLRAAHEWGITILGEPQMDLVPQLRLSGPARLTSIKLHRASQQARTLADAAATLIVRIHDEVQAGDHALVLFRVVEHWRRPEIAPLTYYNRRVDVVHRS